MKQRNMEFMGKSVLCFFAHSNTVRDSIRLEGIEAKHTPKLLSPPWSPDLLPMEKMWYWL